jgi:hypothetical protein
MAAAEAAEFAAMVMVFFAWVNFLLCGDGLWVVGSLTLVPESRSSVTYLNRLFQKSKSIITI